jgi:hypothetical protein
MSNVSLGKHQVSIKLVADVAKKGEGAKIVQNPASKDAGARVGITTDVETYQSGGKATQQAGENVVGTQGKSVEVTKGAGVLGHLLKAQAAAQVPDPASLNTAQLRELLAPHFGKPITVTSYDKEDAATLAEAKKSHSIGDTHAVLVNVTDEGLVLKKDGKESTLHTEFWALARIRLNEDGARDVIAQDPSYPKHFVD